MAEKKGKSFSELFEDNGSMANLGDNPSEPAEDEDEVEMAEEGEDDMDSELDGDLTDIAQDLAAALVDAMDQVLSGEGGDDLADVPDMLDKEDDAPVGDDDKDVPPPPADDDKPDGVDLPDRDDDGERKPDEEAEAPDSDADVELLDKVASIEAKLDAVLGDNEQPEESADPGPKEMGSDPSEMPVKKNGPDGEPEIDEKGDENKMLDEFFGSFGKRRSR